jgi:predicted GH43/DUF377 family glycosyl hydrolase
VGTTASSRRAPGHGRPDRWRGGPVPREGRRRDAWLAIYHGDGSPLTYSLGALLLAADDPSRGSGVARADPVSRDAHERGGFFGNVVFTCGVYVEGDLRIYYGASDGVTCVADLSLASILQGLDDPGDQQAPAFLPFRARLQLLAAEAPCTWRS